MTLRLSDGTDEFLALVHALKRLDDVGGTTRCQRDADRFTYDGKPEGRGRHARAAALCAGCPVLAECGAYADAAHERWHIWGGRDRAAPKPRTRTTRRTTTQENRS